MPGFIFFRGAALFGIQEKRKMAMLAGVETFISAAGSLFRHLLLEHLTFLEFFEANGRHDMGKEKDDRVVHTETRENKSIGRDFGFSGSRKAEAVLGDGRVGKGDGSSDARAIAAAIKNARSK